ncbi:hypothetical protein [Priestia megaterium]|uniref:hypothetical protein n=1 Tax=Priestia megaterium TaxID=1404 RepID=UPI000AD10257|nr:hypothetical protein [Priestia megaterium]
MSHYVFYDGKRVMMTASCSENKAQELLKVAQMMRPDAVMKTVDKKEYERIEEEDMNYD